MELSNLLNWPGDQFMYFFATVSIATLLLLWFLRQLLGSFATGADPAELSVLQIAYLGGGAVRALDTAMVALFAAGAAAFDPSGKLASIAAGTPVPPDILPFRLGSSAIRREDFHAENALPIAALGSALAERGLLTTTGEVARFRATAAPILCVPLALGVAKLMVDLSRGLSLAFLIIGLIVTLGGGLLILLPTPIRSRAGRTVLARLRADQARAAHAPLPDELPLAYALTGVAALNGTDYHGFFPDDDKPD